MELGCGDESTVGPDEIIGPDVGCGKVLPEFTGSGAGSSVGGSRDDGSPAGPSKDWSLLRPDKSITRLVGFRDPLSASSLSLLKSGVSGPRSSASL